MCEDVRQNVIVFAVYMWMRIVVKFQKQYESVSVSMYILFHNEILW